jgi:uncharacterized protein YbjT (DUF2867 family)
VKIQNQSNMKKTILVAGATGDLGGRIVKALLSRGAEVRALVRTGTSAEKTETLSNLGAEVISADMDNIHELTAACQDVLCVVSALQGLHDVIVDLQSELLNAAVAAGVPHFIPSDFSTDYTQIPEGENRNFDLRREFMKIINNAPIAATSIFNGAFGEVLMYNTPFLDFKQKSISYWGASDWKVDFTTMDNTAEYTAAAALDEHAPRILRIAGIQVNAQDMKELAQKLTHEDYELKSMGHPDELSARNKTMRAAAPEGENEIYPGWQRSQYMHSMFTAHHEQLDNNRYQDIQWTGFEALMATRNKH